ncbi:hypothetical protein NN561_016579 [Cricetulus griseus]
MRTTGLPTSQLHALPLLARAAGRQSRAAGQTAKRGRGGTRRGGSHARPHARHEARLRGRRQASPPRPPAQPAIQGGNARREARPTTPARRPDPAQRREPGPAEATPATHLRSDGKPVAKKNVQRDYRTFIPFSPTLGKRAEPAHDTTFPVCPALAPGPPLSAPLPHRRGLWACALPPTRDPP